MSPPATGPRSWPGSARSSASQRLYYSYAGELEPVARVGRMGAEDLFADDEE